MRVKDSLQPRKPTGYIEASLCFRPESLKERKKTDRKVHQQFIRATGLQMQVISLHASFFQRCQGSFLFELQREELRGRANTKLKSTDNFFTLNIVFFS